MRTYLLKRLLMIPLTLVGITFLTFVLIHLAPGDPAATLSGAGDPRAGQHSMETLQQWRTERHLDKPIWKRYLLWVGDLATFDLGKSFAQGRPAVMTRIRERLGVTVILNLIAFFIIYAVAIPIGILAGARQFSLYDRLSSIIVFMLYSLPSFWIASLLINFVTGESSINGFMRSITPFQYFFPSIWESEPWIEQGVDTGSYVLGWVRTGALPVLCMTYAGFAFLSRQMRASLLEVIRQDYIRTARAKGLSERTVILKHAVRNSLIPIVTLFGTLLPAMIAGSVIVEAVFSIKGMGQLFFDAINTRDYPIVMGEVFLTSLLTMAGVLISDILYVFVNPTISYD